ncbi:MAG TPA: glycosyl hydrolase 115 family protein [Povalibacter sp.]|nr:glycosyl hydrolase 115 family protein [Povalibacter sp.]
MRFVAATLLALWLPVQQSHATARWIAAEAGAHSFALVAQDHVADILIDGADHRVVSLAATDLAADIERITGSRATVRTIAGDQDKPSRPVVLVGTLGRNALLEQLIAKGKLDVAALRGRWETFLIATVSQPWPGVSSALVIVGSDRRGTAYGLYELSQAIGVSPWYWWADVTPEHRSALYVDAGTRRFGPPSVRYRGIFINDEDWGLQPWAATNFEPEHGGIGPKTYARVFELLLRLKANTLWPAMHPGTPPFNADPRNAALADDYAIVMGSSHAEPMLRNNVGEWQESPEKYNYVTNRDDVLAYWRERVQSNGGYENLYTLGMRGIHDSAMQGVQTREQQIGLLQTIFRDQRALLDQRGASNAPQIFCAYKEVLEVLRGGLEVPDDVTLVWPDDNFGYVRSFAGASERHRSGGFGVYYHVSYLGRPLAYLWLNTTPPALIWSEMRKSYERGADRVWIANVGDIKPAEIATEFFLQMAWNIDRWRADNLPQFLDEWAAREFGREHAAEIASVLSEYYVLNFARKPEHLQWWLPRETPRPSGWSDSRIDSRLAAFARLRSRADAVQRALPTEQRAAFYQLVGYPVTGAALANERYFHGERAALAQLRGEAAVPALTTRAMQADAALREATRMFGEVSAGKWRNFVRLEPADTHWASMRIEPWQIPQFDAASVADHDAQPIVQFDARRFAARRSGRGGASWIEVPGLGSSGAALMLTPTRMQPITASRIRDQAPRLQYKVASASTGVFEVVLRILPTHPLDAAAPLQLAVSLDSQPPVTVVLDTPDGGPEWAQGVLNGERQIATRVNVAAPGEHILNVYGIAPGVVLDSVSIRP